MRERIARWIALLLAVITVAMSALFAWVHNPQRSADEVPPAPVREEHVGSGEHPGRIVYEAQRCAACHSIAGAGSPRYPLDGVGARLARDELRKWIVGAPELEDALPASAFRRKQQYQGLPESELDALVSWLEEISD